ncbi:MAG: LysM domain-containing protein [Desulfobulbaceae bacterium]|nr:LysM domain-containing protein [Desulfobulbaceae bacterium]
MFGKKSRYYGLETISANDSMGRAVQAVKLRRLADTSGEETLVVDGDQLDVMAKGLYQNPARFWHIADANCDLEANDLVATTGRVIKVPKR